MANDIFSKVNLDNFSSLDLSRTTNMALSVQAEIEENNKLMKQAADEAYNNRQKMQKAIEQTAVNTAETNLQLHKVVENQNAYIDILKNQLSVQECLNKNIGCFWYQLKINSCSTIFSACILQIFFCRTH